MRKTAEIRRDKPFWTGGELFLQQVKNIKKGPSEGGDYN
jgi:hypothetical protein